MLAIECLVNVRDVKYDHQQATADCARVLIKMIPRYTQRERENWQRMRKLREKKSVRVAVITIKASHQS